MEAQKKGLESLYENQAHTIKLIRYLQKTGDLYRLVNERNFDKYGQVLVSIETAKRRKISLGAKSWELLGFTKYENYLELQEITDNELVSLPLKAEILRQRAVRFQKFYNKKIAPQKNWPVFNYKILEFDDDFIKTNYRSGYQYLPSCDELPLSYQFLMTYTYPDNSLRKVS